MSSVKAPFLHSGTRTSSMATWALSALLIPGAIYSMLYPSPFIFQLIGYALLGGLAEGLYHLIVRRKLKFNPMGSALTAALIAASVPPSMPFLPMLYAILIAIWIVKLPMVGLSLRFNAAMVGRLFLMQVYPGSIVAWGTPTPDVISTATPQELYRSEGFALELPQLLFDRIEGVWEELFLLVPGSPGETFPVLLLLLGGLLCYRGIIAWRAPVAFLLSFAIASAAFGDSVLFNLFSSATIFSAAFIVSDPVSTPMSKGGKIGVGILIGVSNAVIRHTTYYTEAIVYAVLLGNLFSPLLDRTAFMLRGRRLNQRLSQPHWAG